MKYFYDLRRHFYSLLPTFANDMRYARNRSADGEWRWRRRTNSSCIPRQGPAEVRHSLVANACRIIKPKVISNRTCLGQERQRCFRLSQEAKVIAANNNSNCSAVTISIIFFFFFFLSSSSFIFGSILGKLGYNVPTMVSSAFIAALQRVGILSATAEATTTSRSSNSNVPKTLFGQCRRHDAAIKRNK